MEFFVPYADAASPADHVWQATRDFLALQGLPTEERRIWKLAFDAGGGPRVIRIGGTHPDLHEEILVILKAADQPAYYVCTPNRGVVRGAPLRLGNAAGDILAVPFSTQAAGDPE